MTLHRRRKPYSRRYAERQLASTQQALASVRALQVGADWRKAATKAQTLRRLEADERKWQAVLEPRPVERFFELPF